MTSAEDAWVGLGSNLAAPAAQVRAALDALAQVKETELVAASPLYASAPMGPSEQPDYVNAVAHLRTRLEPHGLLDALQSIEHAAGRVRAGQRWGPRVLDLDLIAFGDRSIADERLCVPHPGAAERPFVLRPLADVAPQLELPGLGSVGSLLAAVSDTGVWRLE